MEVAILGAGLAGLQAARLLAERGIDVEVFEATDRVGGRVRTEHHDGEVPIELGPEFIHGGPSVLRALVPSSPITLDTISDAHYMQHSGRLVRGDDLWKQVSGWLAPARDRSDRSVRAYVEHAPLDPDDARTLAMFVEGFYAAPLDDISVTGVVADAGGVGDGERGQRRVHGGYGRLVEWVASRVARAGVVVHHGCAVREVHWSGASARIVYVDTGGVSWAEARRVIVALPLGVLRADDTVRFVPELRSHRAAMVHLGIGQVCKLVVCMREPMWRTNRDQIAFVHGRDGWFPTFWVRSRQERHLLTAWAGGRHALALAGLDAGQLAERAIDGFALATGIPSARVGGAVMHVHFHDWHADPWARGAYSYTRVGEGHAPHELLRPLADTVFFAGEATSPHYEGTVTGALGSGNRAANQITRSLRAL